MEARHPVGSPAWWGLRPDSGVLDDPRVRLVGGDGEMAQRSASPAEATGRLTLVWASFTAGMGGAIIAIFSMTFGPRFFTSDIRLLGVLTGLAIVALAAVAPIGVETRKASIGALIIVCAILAFPIAAGGYFIGSIVAIVGGAMFVAYEPPPADVRVTVHRAGQVRRFTGLLIDFVAAFALQRALYALVPDFFNATPNVLVAWAFCWLVVAVVPTIWTRRTAGRILVLVRVVDLGTAERSGPSGPVLRELLRGLIAIGGFFVVARVALGSDLRLFPALVAVAVLAVLAAVAERFNVLDRLTGTVGVYDSIVAQDR